jgi:hypothetical protein
MKAVVCSIFLLGGMMLVMMSTSALLTVQKARHHRFAKRTPKATRPLDGRLFLAISTR